MSVETKWNKEWTKRDNTSWQKNEWDRGQTKQVKMKCNKVRQKEKRHKNEISRVTREETQWDEKRRKQKRIDKTV